MALNVKPINQYTVRGKQPNEQADEQANEEEKCQQLPHRFDDLPRDAQWLAIKRTAARFVVTRRSQEKPAQLLLPYTFFWPYYVPVIVHYEFRLLPRRARGPEMIARFTLNLDPAIQQLREWRYMSTEHQALFLKERAWLARDFEPFSQLRVQEIHARDDTNKSNNKLFCFLRTSGQRQREVAPPWSKFDDLLLKEVRDKMEKMFKLEMV
jgi:hypothetical protein